MRIAKVILITPMILLGLILSLPQKAYGDVATCAGAASTCWIFDTITSVMVTNFPNNNETLTISGNVGATSNTFLIGVPPGKDPIYSSIISNCQKMAMLAQVSPNKVKLRVDSSGTTTTNFLITSDISSTPYIYCYTVSP